MATQKINIALVDDHALFRSGIANLLSEFADLSIVFEAANGKELQQLLPGHQEVDVILMDINMPLVDGYAATVWVRQHYPLIQILALSMFDDDLAIIKMVKAGAGGYVLKESKPAELYRAINEIKEKGLYINEIVSGRIMRSMQQPEQPPAGESLITVREAEFIQYCASELTYKEIADKMKVAARTVDNYRQSLFDKLDLRSRVGLVLYAIKNGIVKL
ncbi:MAG TPA: response regulator transcription factor [Puia sp.]|nr:response regulator transcription factor [Puia sp.]